MFHFLSVILSKKFSLYRNLYWQKCCINLYGINYLVLISGIKLYYNIKASLKACLLKCFCACKTVGLRLQYSLVETTQGRNNTVKYIRIKSAICLNLILGNSLLGHWSAFELTTHLLPFASFARMCVTLWAEISKIASIDYCKISFIWHPGCSQKNLGTLDNSS